MFNLENQIAEWRAETSRSGIRNPEVLDELEAHLREQMERLGPEHRDAAAFQDAVRQLGDGKKLKKEFSKLKWGFFGYYRENPPTLNLLAVWFVLAGLDSLYMGARHLVWHNAVFPLFMGSFFGLQILAGLGLLCRYKFWHRAAFVFFTLDCYFLISAMVFRWVTPMPAEYYTGYYKVFMILDLPTRYHWVTDFFHLGVILCGSLYLASPSVARLFLSRSKPETA